MIKFILTLALACVSANCFAMLPVNDSTLADARGYGELCAQGKAREDLLEPWSARDFRAVASDRNERAVLYTPYLLAALQTNELIAGGANAPEPGELREFLHRYNGMTVLGLSVVVPEAETSDTLTVELVQGNICLTPYACEELSSRKTEAVTLEGSGNTAAQLNYIDQLRYREQEISRQLRLAEAGKLHLEDINLPPVTAKRPLPPDRTTIESRELELLCYFDDAKFSAERPYMLYVTDGIGVVREFHIMPSVMK